MTSLLIREWYLFGDTLSPPAFVSLKLRHYILREILIEGPLFTPPRLIVQVSFIHLEGSLLTLHLTLLEVLPENAQISQHHRFISCYVSLVGQRYYFASIKPKTLLARSLVLMKIRLAPFFDFKKLNLRAHVIFICANITGIKIIFFINYHLSLGAQVVLQVLPLMRAGNQLSKVEFWR